MTNAPPYDAADWRALQRRTSLPLYAPSSWPAGLGYAQFRACRIATSQGRVPAAVVVGTAPQGGYWDVQALAWGDPPLLTAPTALRRSPAAPTCSTTPTPIFTWSPGMQARTPTGSPTHSTTSFRTARC